MTTTKPEPGRDPRVEAMLDRHHIKWVFDPALKLDRIDIKASLRNQARADTEPLLAETVELYTHAYTDGAVFPGIIVRPAGTRTQKVVILGGLHRTHGALAAGRTTHPAYIAQAADEVAMVVMIEDNMTHGAPLPKAQRLALAVHLTAIGWTIGDAAKQTGVSRQEVSDHTILAATTTRAHQLGIHSFNELPQRDRMGLGRIQSDPVFSEASRLFVAVSPAGDDATKLMRRIKEARSEEEAFALIATELEERRDAVQKRYGNKKIKQTAFGTVKGSALDILSTKPADVAGSIPASVNTAQFREQLRKTAKHLMAIAEAL